MQKKQPLISIVAPVFNEAQSVDIFFSRILKDLNKITDDWELIFVNDGSTDDTLKQLIMCYENNDKVVIVDFSRNFGKEAAVSAGLKYAKGEAIIPIDIDLQDPPELIEKMVKEWNKGYDVVLAMRRKRDGDTQIKKGTAAFFYWFINKIGNIEIPKNVGDFRLMDRKVVDYINQFPEKNRMMKGLFAWVGFNTTNILYDRPNRKLGKTRFNYRSLMRLAYDAVIGYSTLPLKIWFYLAIILLVIAFAMILSYDYNTELVAILLCSGLQFAAIGILGEYISRIYDEVKGRPLYIVKHLYTHKKQRVENRKNISELF